MKRRISSDPGIEAILRWKDRRHRRAGRRIGDTIAKGSDLLVFNSVVLDPPGWPAILYTLHTPPRAIDELARGVGIHNHLLSDISPAVEENQEEDWIRLSAVTKAR